MEFVNVLFIFILIAIIIFCLRKSRRSGANEKTVIILASKSEKKKAALESALQKLHLDQFNIETINCDGAGIPNQPVDCGKECCEYRIEYVKKQKPGSSFIIAVEGAANKINGDYYEILPILVNFMLVFHYLCYKTTLPTSY